MCGFVGVLSSKPNHHNHSVLTKMVNAISHRGPDDSGIWLDPDAGISLGHCRLSIIDISQAGHQPMHSHSDRYTIAYNGEIYNYQQLRRELEGECLGHDWHGHSDTEVLLAGFETWGIEATIKKAVGMFAFALWDKKLRKLYLGRDRIGEKPLYYGWQNQTFLFGSELKALRAHSSFGSQINRDALALLMRHNYIPAPYSIYTGIYKLLPGNLLILDAEQAFEKTGGLPPLKNYWSLKESIDTSRSALFTGSDTQAIDALNTHLMGAVQQQMIADVPLGAFLSGGIDSSAIVALMQAQSDQPINTFTIGFHEKGYNEAEHAKAVANHLGTYHTELYVSSKHAMDIIPSLPTLYDEPFSDSSQIPTFLVSQMTRQHVTVSLSGDGGDELFGGYNRYFLTKGLWEKLSVIPMPMRALVAKAITSLPPRFWDHFLTAIFRVLPFIRVSHPGDKAHKLADLLAARDKMHIYKDLVSHEKSPSELVLGATEPSTVLTNQDGLPDLQDFEHQMMYLDSLSYLPDDILVKVDRAAMGVSLETRVPFLDHRVVELAWQLPLHMKIRDGQGKWVLRQLLNRYVPNNLFERPKMGFGLPIDSWLRGPLRDWAEGLLEPTRLKQEGFFNPAPIQQKWDEHMSGKRNWQYHLWDVLMFQAWLEKNQ